MDEFKLDFTGWKALIVAVILIAILGVKFVTLSDKKDDKVLMKELELLLMTEYFPDDVERLRAALDTGDRDEIGEVADSVTSTKLNIESVQASVPILTFASSKGVVVKVTYSIDDASGNRGGGTKYYRFKHGSLFNSWQYQHESSTIGYYLNFM